MYACWLHNCGSKVHCTGNERRYLAPRYYSQFRSATTSTVVKALLCFVKQRYSKYHGITFTFFHCWWQDKPISNHYSTPGVFIPFKATDPRNTSLLDDNCWRWLNNCGPAHEYATRRRPHGPRTTDLCSTLCMAAFISTSNITRRCWFFMSTSQCTSAAWFHRLVFLPSSKIWLHGVADNFTQDRIVFDFQWFYDQG